MYSDKKNLLQTVALLRAHGISEVVVCPGSRNAPFAKTFADSPDFNCYAVTDERSAGFFAIGRALQTGRPAVVCCTSGSALLNLHPAVCEAYYQRIPLVVVSADRPAAWIGQMDGQTLPQPGVFGTLVKKSVNLPEIHTEEDEWFVNRLVNEALLELDHHGCGPVHINVPLSEPLFNFTTETLPEVRRMIRFDGMADSGRELKGFLASELPRFHRCMVISGQMRPDEAACLAAAIPSKCVAWLTEIIGNASGFPKAVRGFDTLLYAADEDLLQRLRPDLVITLGGHIVSKRLKQFLRHTQPLVHWHVSPDGAPADLFGCLTAVFESPADDFCRALSQVVKSEVSDYAAAWSSACAALPSPEVDYSELTAVRRVLEALPVPAVLHLANSSSVRLAELCPLPAGIEVHCNRGVNGIEGSMSTSVGYAAFSSRMNVFLVGDLSFFYDMNALWNSYVQPNLRIVVFNNGAGAIFHALPGLKIDEPINRIVTARHETSAEGWARERGFIYLRADNAHSLQDALPAFYDNQAAAPCILEIFTEAMTDAVELRNYYHHLKNWSNSSTQ